MAEAVRELKVRRSAAHFESLKNSFRDIETGKTFQSGELRIVEHHRLEWIRGPNDLSVVYAIKAKNGTRGALADAYGPYAHSEEHRAFTDVTASQNGGQLFQKETPIDSITHPVNPIRYSISLDTNPY